MGMRNDVHDPLFIRHGLIVPKRKEGTGMVPSSCLPITG